MLAPTSPPSSSISRRPPSRQACSMHIDRRAQDVLEPGRTPPARRRSAVNRFIRSRRPSFGSSWSIGRWLLQAFLDMAGTGDVGPTLTVAGDSRSDPDQELPRLDQLPQASLSLDLRRDRHRADLLRPRPGRSRPLGRPTPPAATPVFVLAPAVAGDVRGRRCSRRGDPEAGDDPRSGDRRQGVGGSQPGAGQRCGGVSGPPPGSGRRRGRTALGGDGRLQRGALGAYGAAAGRRRPTPRCRPWRTSVVARARRRTRRRWRRWGRCIRSSRSCARPTM